MKTQTKPSLSLWTITAPLKTSLIMSAFTFAIMFGYSFISSLIYKTPAQMPQTPLFFLLGLGFLLSVFLVVRKLPSPKMDQDSFVAIHTSQTILSSALVGLSTFLILANHQTILFKLMMLEAKHSGILLIALIFTTIFLFYLVGLSIINLYVKIRRIQEFNIPTWKIVFSIPFGFSALWVPGYFLSKQSTKQFNQPIKSKIYSRFIKWTVTAPQNTIATFAFITLLSCIGIGLNSVLLTLSFAMLFGIWIMQIGKKNFIKQIPGKYSSAAVIINIALIIILSTIFALAPQRPANIQINISDITTTETTGNI